MIDDLLEDWFPLELTCTDGVTDDVYLGPQYVVYDTTVGEWFYLEFDGRQFYSSADSITSALGDWLLFPFAGYEEGSSLEVSRLDVHAWSDRVRSAKQTLLHAAEQVMNYWASRGWRFTGTSRAERLQEVLRWYPPGWERAVGVFAVPSDRNMFHACTVSSLFSSRSPW